MELDYCYMCKHATYYSGVLLYCSVWNRYVSYYHAACERFERVR